MPEIPRAGGARASAFPIESGARASAAPVEGEAGASAIPLEGGTSASAILLEGGASVSTGALHAVESRSPGPALALAAACVARLGRDAVIVDAGCSAGPYPLVRACKRLRADRRQVLDRVHVARAFTAYQLEAVAVDAAPRLARLVGAGALCLVHPSRLFGGAELDEYESRCLLARTLRAVESVASSCDLAALVVDSPLPPRARRRARILLESDFEAPSAVSASESALAHLDDWAWDGGRDELEDSWEAVPHG